MLLDIRELLVPVLDTDPVPIPSLLPEGETWGSVVGEQPAAVGAVDTQLGCDVGDGRGARRGAKLLGSEVHAATVVPIGHGVNGAPLRLLRVSRKSSNLSDPQLTKTVGSRFKSECKGLNITQEWLESVTGVPRTSIGRFQGGKRGIHSDGLVLVLAKAAERGVNLDYVFTGRRSATDALLKVLGDPDVVEGLRRMGATEKTGTT